MWQYVMNGKKHSAAALCFAALCALHIAVFGIAGLSPLNRKIPAVKQNPPLVFDLVFPDSGDAAESPAAQEAVQGENPPASAQAAESAEDPDAVETAETTGIAALTAETSTEANEAPGPEEIAASGASVGGHTAAEMARKMSESDYIALIMRRLEEKKVYPLAMRKRGIEGDMTVQFTIRPDGSLAQVQPAGSKSHPFLVQAALETVKSASPFPIPVMEEINGDFSLQVVIKYQLE
jgi:protein TonB